MSPYLKSIFKYGYPTIRVLESAPDPEAIVDGKVVLLFCSNNYLSLSSDHRVREAAHQALDKYGLGTGGSRVLSGNMKIHEELEAAIADFKSTEAAAVFPAGFQTNLGVIDAFVNFLGTGESEDKKNTIIFSDELNHASIIDACRFSNANVIVYKHRDMHDLEAKLFETEVTRKLIVTDSIFSMVGDIAPLQDIAQLADKYEAKVMVDDAHGTGVLGKEGRGTLELLGLDGKVSIIMGTFSKALGAMGGFIAGERRFIELLRISARPYLFSAGLSPAVAAGVLRGLDLIKEDASLRERLWKNTNYLKGELNKGGFYFFGSETPILPLFVGDERKAVEAADLLFEKGIFAPCARWPAVPKGSARIRITLMSKHTTEQVDKLVSACTDVWQELNIPFYPSDI